MRIKKILAAVIAASAVMCCGCSDTGVQDAAGGDKLSIVTTIFPAYDFARQVFGDTAEVTMLLKPGTESHSYDPTARDIVKIDSCDLFIYNGGESDAWVEGILNAADDVDTLRMMDSVEALEEEHTDGMQTNEDKHSHDEEEYDEHIWTSPKNAALIVKSVLAAAEKISPENAEVYRNNAESYITQIDQLDSEFSALFSGEERYFVFGDRFPLLYFFREYGLNYYAAFPGCGSEVEPSAQTISFLLDRLDDSDTIKTVFYIELSNHKLADTLAEDKNIPTAEFNTCHNITADDFSAGESYVSLMQRNYDVLSTALS